MSSLRSSQAENEEVFYDVKSTLSREEHPEEEDIVNSTQDDSLKADSIANSPNNSSTNSIQNNLTFDNVKPVSITAKNISITLNRKDSIFRRIFKRSEKFPDIEAGLNRKTKLLDDVSFNIPSGSLFAIIGGSGSGKTTLLNTLSKRSSMNNSSLRRSGEVFYNDTTNLDDVNHAYVIQQDILIPNLTCYETLKYAANLRLSSKLADAKQTKLIEEIIVELGLKDCRDTMVGNRQHKGLSGGEKRRLSIGIQLLSNPSLLFLDEPTTGLDSRSAILLINTLKNLTKKGRTIILSIHQPPSDVFFKFDYLCILSRGCPVYCDKTSDSLEYFHRLNYTPVHNVNPADYLIDITSVDTRNPENEKITLENLENFKYHWRNYEKEKALIIEPFKTEKSIVTANDFSEHFTLKHSRANLLREVTVLTKREFVLTARDPLTTISLCGEAAFLGCILGWAFLNPDDSLTGIRSRSAAIYNINGLQGYLMLIFEAFRLCHQDIKIYDRERAEGSITVLGFILSRKISKLFTEDVIVPTIFTITTYFLIQFKQTARGFFIYWSINLFNQQLAMAFALLAVSISRDYPIATTIGNINFTFQSYCCGFFVNIPTMPVYVKWIKYLCYVWYAYGLTTSSYFTDYFGDCPYSSKPDDPRCVSYTGKNIIENLGFWENWIILPEFILLAFVIIFYTIAACFLYLHKVDVAIAKQSAKNRTKVEKFDEEETKVINDSEGSKSGSPTLDGIDINLRNLNLSVKVLDVSIKAYLIRLLKFDFKWFRERVLRNKDFDKGKKIILQNVNATFEKHKVNAIMGPSGSGKTTLLNLISGKLNSNFVTEYTQSGDIYFNEFKVDKRFLSGICSYVLQDDDSLLPSLTVKETLLFAGKLRLAKKLTSKQIEEKVNDITLKLGLKDCQNNFIGSELIKGISGGEKRRVSIGIQLLNDPQVLFLDEPTSGLDSFTALSILNILEHLATVEKRTVVLTIHQPRYSMFQKFGKILLLAKGGNIVFNGDPVLMEDYFLNLNFQCPKLTNFADFVLNLVSVNSQSLKLEQNSKARVDSLVKNWNDNYLPQEVVENNDPVTAEEVFKPFRKIPASFLVAFPIVLRRQVRNVTIIDVLARTFQITGTAFISALFFAPIKKDYIGVSNILGLVQQFSSVYFVGMLNNVAAYTMERDYFYEEYSDHVYGITPFFISYSIIETFFELLSGAVYAAVMVFAIGLPGTAGVYFLFFYGCWLMVSCGESLGIVFNTIFTHTGFAINVISAFLSIAVIIAGLLSLQLPDFFRGINWINPVHYAVMSAINLVFLNEEKFTCSPNSGMAADGKGCIFNNGDDVLDTYGIRENWKLQLGLLAVVAVAYRLIAYVVLWIKVNHFQSDAIRRLISKISL